MGFLKLEPRLLGDAAPSATAGEACRFCVGSVVPASPGAAQALGVRCLPTAANDDRRSFVIWVKAPCAAALHKLAGRTSKWQIGKSARL